jgi:hypothetical protein
LNEENERNGFLFGSIYTSFENEDVYLERERDKKGGRNLCMLLLHIYMFLVVLCCCVIACVEFQAVLKKDFQIISCQFFGKDTKT